MEGLYITLHNNISKAKRKLGKDAARQPCCCVGGLVNLGSTGTRTSRSTGSDLGSVPAAAVKPADVDSVSHVLRLMECQW